jgi:aminoglycoside 3-N-acetyltransferase
MNDSYINTISEQLLNSGVKPGGILLVHSSLKSLGHVPGGPETVISGMLKALGPEGTLLLPALSYESANSDNPVFSLLETPSNVGAIPEYFRTRPDSIRSVHPTHSVCGIGKMAETILGRHHLDNTPAGPNSPFRLLKENDGHILFLGCGLKHNTSMHGVEELEVPDYLFSRMIDYKMILPDHGEMTMACRRHSFNGFAQRYDRLESLLDDTEMKRGVVLDAEVFIIESPQMWVKARNTLNADPHFFVEKLDNSL